MSETNFEELLARQVDSVERPKLYPIGNYSAIIASHEFGKSSKKETPFVKFDVKLVGAGNDVDEEMFEEAGGNEGLNKKKPLALYFYLTPDALFRLRLFLENTLALDCASRPFDAMIPETANCSLTASCKHQAGQKEGEFYMFIDDTSVAE